MLHQIVYVVLDSIRRVIIGVCNTEKDAKEIALNAEQPDYLGNEITITPVLVDSMYEQGEDGYRPLCWNDEQLQNGLKNEVELAAIIDQQEAEAEAEEDDEDIDDEDIDEDDEDIDDEDEDEDEDDEEDDEDDEDSTVDIITEAAETIANAVADALRAVWDKINE